MADPIIITIYLKDNGDGTYVLTLDPAEAAITTTVPFAPPD